MTKGYTSLFRGVAKFTGQRYVYVKLCVTMMMRVFAQKKDARLTEGRLFLCQIW